MNRHPTRPELIDYLFHLLPDASTRSMADHLAACPECRQTLDGLKATFAPLEELKTPAETPERLIADTLREIRKRRADPANFPIFRWAWITASAAAAMVVLLMFVIPRPKQIHVASRATDSRPAPAAVAASPEADAIVVAPPREKALPTRIEVAKAELSQEVPAAEMASSASPEPAAAPAVLSRAAVGYVRAGTEKGVSAAHHYVTSADVPHKSVPVALALPAQPAPAPIEHSVQVALADASPYTERRLMRSVRKAGAESERQLLFAKQETTLGLTAAGAGVGQEKAEMDLSGSADSWRLGEAREILVWRTAGAKGGWIVSAVNSGTERGVVELRMDLPGTNWAGSILQGDAFFYARNSTQAVIRFAVTPGAPSSFTYVFQESLSMEPGSREPQTTGGDVP